MSQDIQLADFLFQISDLEKTIEVMRQLLSELPGFHPYTLFKKIDRLIPTPLGMIDSRKLQIFLNNNGFTFIDCIPFIKNYDNDNDDMLSYSEFLKAILPLNNLEYQKLPFQQQNPQKLDFTLAQLINKEILLTKELKRKGLNAKQCFKMIDIHSTDRLFIQDFQRFFFKLNLAVYEDEILRMMRRLDRKSDGVIDLQELTSVLTPQSVMNTQLKQQVESSHKNNKQKNNNYKKYSSEKVSSKPTLRNKSQRKNKYLEEKTKLRAELQHIKLQKKQQKSSTNPLLKQKQSSDSLVKTKQKQKKSNRSIVSNSVEIVKRQKTSPSKYSNTFQQNVQDYLSLIAEMIATLIDRESAIEQNKQRLWIQDDFNLIESFRSMDTSQKGQLTIADLDTFFKYKKNFQPLIKSNGSYGKLKYSDFIRLLEPKQKSYPLKGHQIMVYPERLDKLFSQGTYLLFTNLFEMILDYEEIFNKIKEDFKLFNLEDIFNTIDQVSKDKNLSKLDIQHFLQMNQITCQLQDIELLIMKLDRDMDGKLTLQDFIKSFT